MKKRKKCYVATREKAFQIYGDPKASKAIILVYGELVEDGVVPGVCIQNVGLSKDGRRVLERGEEVVSVTGRRYARTKSFNMGWAICAPGDEFNEEKGIKIAKKRFSVSPLTTQSGNFLTHDMIVSIMENEVNFISKNFEKFYRRTEENKVKIGPVVTLNEGLPELEQTICKEIEVPEVKKPFEQVKVNNKTVGFTPDTYIVKSNISEEDGKYILNVAKVRKDSGDSILVYWVLTYKQVNGAFSRSIQSGTNIQIQREGWRAASKEELSLISNLPDFKKSFIS